MKKNNLTLKKEDFIAYYKRKLTKDWIIVSIISLLLFSIASIIYNSNDYYLLLITCFLISIYVIKILKTIKRNQNQIFSLSITNTDYEILRPNEKGKMISTYYSHFKDFLYYDEYKNHIFLYVQKRMVFILNKNNFTSKEWEELKKAISSQVRLKKANTFIIFLNFMVSSMLLISMISGFING